MARLTQVFPELEPFKGSTVMPLTPSSMKSTNAPKPLGKIKDLETRRNPTGGVSIPTQTMFALGGTTSTVQQGFLSSISDIMKSDTSGGTIVQNLKGS